MKPVEDQIRDRTPVESGELKASVKTKLGIGPINKAIKQLDGPGRGRRTDVAQAVSSGWYGQSFFKMINVEYGNTHQPPANVIRSALEDNGQEALNIFSKEWKKGLEKAALRLGKRKGLGKLKIK